VVAVVLGAVVLTVHGNALEGFWRFDDPWLILNTIESPSAAAAFVSPELKRGGTPFFTPWQSLEYWIDVSIFGLEPRGFYAHHLAILWMCSIATVCLLRRRAGVVGGVAVAALFLIGAPTLVVGQQLMSRHYVTGLFFSILSTLCALRGQRSGSRGWDAMASLLYLLAVLNKEIFLPLPLVLFFAFDPPIKARVRRTAPFAVVAGVFLVWRSIMLGELVGGYGGRGVGSILDVPASVSRLIVSVFGGGWSQAAAFAVAMTAAMVLILDRPGRPVFLAAAVAVFLPFLVVGFPADPIDLRLGFVSWWALCLVLGFAFLRLEVRALRRVLGGAFFGLLVVLAGVQSLGASKTLGEVAAEYDVQGRFLLRPGNSAVFIPYGAVARDMSYQHAITELVGIAAEVNGEIPQIIPFAESAPLLSAVGPVYSYDREGASMRRLPRTVDHGALVPVPDDERPRLLLGALFDRSRTGVTWKLDVIEECRCFLVSRQLNFAATIPCSGRIRYAPPRWLQGEVRAMARIDDGRWSASPPLTFPGEGQRLEWVATNPNHEPVQGDRP
jgi:hypothetical protein